MSDDKLDELMVEVKASTSPPQWPSGAARGIAKIRYTHDAMIDRIIACPHISQNELAAVFDYSPSWISQIISSDAFQARLAERTKELVDPAIRFTVEEQFKGIVARSMEILREKLSRPSTQISDNLTLRALELSSRALGYGAREQTPAVSQDVHIHLENLGERLVGLLHKKRSEVIEGEIIEGSADA